MKKLLKKHLFETFIGIVSLVTFASTVYGQETVQDTPNHLLIDEIRCSGNTSTDCSYIKRALFLAPGEKVNEDEIKNAKFRLGLTGLFKEVDITLQKGVTRGHVIVDIRVEEGTPFFSEFTAGNSIQNFKSIQVFQETFGNRNIFGRGKILQGSARVEQSFTRDPYTRLLSRVEYIDPHLFQIRRLYFTTGLAFASMYAASKNYKSDFHQQYLSPFVNLGVRIFDFSYINFGYRYFLLSRFEGRYETNHYSLTGGKHGFYLAYGWNSTDDPYFPTQGSVFILGLGLTTGPNILPYGAFGFRRYWLMGDGISQYFNLGATRFFDEVSFGANDQIPISFGISRDLKRNQISDEIRTARLNVEGGFAALGWSKSTKWIIDPGAKLGVTLDTKSFGYVNLFLIYMQSLGRGAR